MPPMMPPATAPALVLEAPVLDDEDEEEDDEEEEVGSAPEDAVADATAAVLDPPDEVAVSV